MPWTERKYLKAEGWSYQSHGFPLGAIIPWGPCGLHSKGSAGANPSLGNFSETLDWQLIKTVVRKRKRKGWKPLRRWRGAEMG